MKKLFGILLLATCTALMTACQTSVEEKQQDLSYSFTENGCATGKVQYKDSADLCTALKDDARNNHCASSLRYNMFKEQCAGVSWN